MRLAKNERRSGPLLGLRVRRERPDTRTRRASIDDDRHERHQQGRGEVRRGEPEGGVPVRQEGQHPWGAFADQAEEHVVVRNGVRAQSPQADTAGHRQGHESARFDNLAQHETPAGLAVDGGD